MSFNLRDEILKLTDTAPVIKDVEDPYSDDGYFNIYKNN